MEGMSKVQACVNMDRDNKIYLKERGGSASEFINWIIRKYREEEETRKTLGEPPLPSQGDDEILKEALEKTPDEKKEREIKIRAWFGDWENKGIIYYAIKVRRPTKADLCKMQKEMYFSKYKLDVTTKEIAEVLRSEMTTFDVENYERERQERIERGGR